MNRMLLIVAGAVLAAGCTPELSTYDTPGLGDAVRHNMAVHALPVDAAAALGTPTRLPGRRADVAMERYMTGTVRAPEPPKTLDAKSLADQ